LLRKALIYTLLRKALIYALLRKALGVISPNVCWQVTITMKLIAAVVFGDFALGLHAADDFVADNVQLSIISFDSLSLLHYVLLLCRRRFQMDFYADYITITRAVPPPIIVSRATVSPFSFAKNMLKCLSVIDIFSAGSLRLPNLVAQSI